MTTVYLVGGPKCGLTITTEDLIPKGIFRFAVGNFNYIIHTYFTMRVVEDYVTWFVARHESISEEEALEIFLEKHYVGLIRRKCR